MTRPVTENANTKTIEESGWVFSLPTNFVALDVNPPAIMEEMHANEIEELGTWKTWVDLEPNPEFNEAFSEATMMIQLTDVDTEVALQALLNPPEPTTDLIAAFRKHRTK
jgi:hypothetical protein